MNDGRDPILRRMNEGIVIDSAGQNYHNKAERNDMKVL